MKKLVFLRQFQLNEESFRIGDERKFTTISKGTNSKNRWYLPEDLIDHLVMQEIAVVVDPEPERILQEKIVADHVKYLDNLKVRYAKGLISTSELLLFTMSNTTATMLDIENVGSKVKFEQDQLNLRIEKLKQEL
jgi:DNA helicase TIP49 (TBP-interacting protein)